MKRVKQLAIVSFVVLGGVLLAGCQNKPKQTGQAQSPEKVQQRIPQTDTVRIVRMKFVPDTVSIQLGDTLVFINKGIVMHNVVQYPDQKWKSPLLHSGDVWKYVPEKEGRYFCSIHKVMKGYIIIE